MNAGLLLGAAAAAIASVLIAGGTAIAKDRKECDRIYKPSVGQAGKDVVWIPTPDELVQRMLAMTKVTPKDIVYDLGSGDGKILIAAARLGATAVGIEYNPDLVKLSRCYVEAEGLAGKVRIIHGDIFKEDFSKATVVTMYLLPELNLRLRPTILAMRPGTRVTSHQFTMGDWEPDESAEIDHRVAYMWVVPAKVEGNWGFRDASGRQFDVTLTQKYQKISGELTGGGPRQPLVGATLRGEEIRFAFNDDKGVTRTLTGIVRGNQIDGVLRAAGAGETKVTGTRR